MVHGITGHNFETRHSIGTVLSEEKIFEKDYDVRRTPSDGNSSPDPVGQES
jgi:hypothetical protein